MRSVEDDQSLAGRLAPDGKKLWREQVIELDYEYFYRLNSVLLIKYNDVWVNID